MQCHICQEETDRFQDEKSGMTYHWCKECEYIFKDPSCYQSIEAQKLRYDLHENDPEDEGYRAYFQRFLDFISEYLSKEGEALDFGCGRSRLLASMLEAKGLQCDAYDPIYHPEGFQRGKKYDLIVSTEVFEHLHKPKEVFGMLTEHLKEGGVLALQTQFHPNEAEAFDKWYYHKDPTHIVFFRPRTFQTLAKEFGCRYVADNGKNMVLLKKAYKEEE